MVIFFIWVPQCLPFFQNIPRYIFTLALLTFVCGKMVYCPCRCGNRHYYLLFSPSAVAVTSSLLFFIEPIFLLFFFLHATLVLFLSSREYGWMCTGGRCWLKNLFSVLDSPSLSLHPPVTTTAMACKKKTKISSRFFFWGKRKSAVGSILRHSQKQHAQRRKGRQEQLFIAREAKNCGEGQTQRVI